MLAGLTDTSTVAKNLANVHLADPGPPANPFAFAGVEDPACGGVGAFAAVCTMLLFEANLTWEGK